MESVLALETTIAVDRRGSYSAVPVNRFDLATVILDKQPYRDEGKPHIKGRSK